jgi:transketolase
MSVQAQAAPPTSLDSKDKQRLEDVGFMTCMTLTLLGNYAQTGHFGGPLAYTPYNVSVHLAGPELGGLRHDYRRPKHPYGDKFMLAAGHCAPTCYALWIIMGEALYRKYRATGDKKYYVAPKDGFLSIDALGFRRGAGALKTLLQDQKLADEPLFAQAREGGRGIHALSGHIESIDQSNDVNGGPSGVGLATAAGKAAFWDMVGAPVGAPKVIAFEGEFALCAGHAQEVKNQALALKVGKRLRVMFSENNAGIDDSLLGGVIDSKFTGYDFVEQWKSYGWNVMTMANGHDYDQIVSHLKTMEDWDPADRRPMILIGKTIKGYWPTASNGKIGSFDQVVGYPSHPYAMKMNSEYFVMLAKTFEDKYGVEFQGIRSGAVTDPKERLIQFKTNMDVALSVLDKNGLGDWLANRIVEIGDEVKDDFKLRIDVTRDPFLDDRLKVANLPTDAQTVKVKNPVSGAEKDVKIALFRKAGEVAGARRGISEIIKWMNYVTLNRVPTIAADLSESVNLEHGSLWGHYDPEKNPAATRLKAAIQEAGNASTAIGLVGQNASLDPDKFAGVWAWSGTYGAFTPLMYLPARVWSQQNQDSRFRTGVLHILAGHSGPETAADARTHFGIFSPQVWKLFPRGQVITLSFWDYNDVAAGYYAAAEIAAREKKVGIIVVEVARPDFPVADRSTFADTDVKAAAKGLYVIRDFAPGTPKHGYVIAQGSSSTFNLVSILPKLDEAGINVKVISAISEELFDHQPEAYRHSVLPPEAVHDLMFVSSGTRRMWPLRNVGPLTDAYSMTSDWDNQWLTGGLEADVIAEAHLDQKSILSGVQRFANDRSKRLDQTRSLLAALEK